MHENIRRYFLPFDILIPEDRASQGPALFQVLRLLDRRVMLVEGPKYSEIGRNTADVNIAYKIEGNFNLI